MKEKWEYRFEVLSLSSPLRTLQDQLNELGWQGWEVVSLAPNVKVKGGKDALIALLKRAHAGSA